MRNVLFMVIFLPICSYAQLVNINHPLNKNHLIGKWKCQLAYQKNNLPIKQTNTIHFLRDGILNEHIIRYEGDKKSYEFQVENTYAQSNWQLTNNQLSFSDYQINRYTIRMPNADKDDAISLDIAAEKSLVTIDRMINPKLINHGNFNIKFLNKNSFEKYQDNETLTCKKKWF